MREQPCPLHSLIEGSWFKLICGASYQHLPAVRNLALAYSLAGADCIDVAADAAVIAATREGIQVAQAIQAGEPTVAQKNDDCFNYPASPKVNTQFGIASAASPWLMVSINDGEDPHFRKAKFEPRQCPSDCPQPCVGVCPAEAIDLNSVGVLERLCYGCGRCVPICPQELITTNSHVVSPKQIAPWIASKTVDALEIHTQVGHEADFRRVWQEIAPVANQLKVLAISCTDGINVTDYLRSLYELITPLPCPLIWQTDGRSMSGDIGKGTTHAAIAFAQKVLQANLPGYIQLAGGTNDYTVDKLQQFQMWRSPNLTEKKVSGVAYGSYARTILSPILAKLENTGLQNIQSHLINHQPMNQFPLKLEQNPDLLEQAVKRASQLVSQIKQSY